jgi:hypothetical protein
LSSQHDPEAWDEDDLDDDRYLVFGAPSGRFPKGYTDEPILAEREEPQYLTRRQWRNHVKKRADQAEIAERMQRERDAKLLSQEERIVKAQKDAALQRRDVRREMWILRQMQAKQRPPALIEKRVQILERVVYLGRRAA